MRVLIVDDEPLVRLSLQRALIKAGHEVMEAEDGQRGLENWKVFRPQLVFLDILMPRLSGPDLLKKLDPELKLNCKVILMSAFAGDFDLEKVKALGADLFLPKPFEDIFSVVELGEEIAGAR